MYGERVVRYLIAGFGNTALTYLVYVALINVISEIAAYTVSYGLGVVVAYFLNRKFVFQVRFSIPRMLVYPLVYVIQYGVGLAVLVAVQALFSCPKVYAALFSIAVGIPIGYVMNKLVLVPLNRVRE